VWQFVDVAQGTNEASTPIATSTLTRDSSGALWSKGACSRESIAGDGFVEFTVNVTGKYRALGFSSVGTPSINFTGIGHGVYLKGGGTPTEFAAIRVGGAEEMTGTYAAGDVFRVERIGTTVRLYQNGEYKHTYVTTSSGARQVDSAYFDPDSVMQNVRVYDAAKKTWPGLTWIVTGVVASTGSAHVPRRFRFLTPSKVKTGDVLVVIIGSQGRDFVVANSATWEAALATITSSLRRGFIVQRRFAEDNEPRQHLVDVASRHESIAAMLVYRGPTDPTAMSGMSAVDHVATTDGFSPMIAKTRALDFVVGASLLHNPQGVTITAISGATQRAQFQTTVFTTPERLTVFEMATRNVGNTGAGVKASGLPGGASFGSMSVLVPGRPSAKIASLSSEPPGAVGLQTVGI